MATGLTPSEVFVAGLCERSFLKLWTHPNPKGKKGKELCDCLVVCGLHVVIISVKEIEYRDTADATGVDRWTRAAIEESAKQIWGAERWLETVDTVERQDGRLVTLPPKVQRRYHRISVSLGAQGQVPLKWGELGNGFVHVCDERSVDALFSTLDTITDFTAFLEAVEQLISRNVKVLLAGGGIEDFVALYLTWDYSFSRPSKDGTQPDMLIAIDALWPSFSTSDGFKSMQDQLKASYVWDRLVDYFADHLLNGTLIDMHKHSITQDEMALIVMALQPRWHRLELAEAFLEITRADSKVRARVARGHNAVAFVYLMAGSEDRKKRLDELTLRCTVVRGYLPDCQTVVGLGTDRPGTSKIGYSADLVYFHFPQWTPENAATAKGIRDELGYFKDVDWNKTAQRRTQKKSDAG